MEQKKPVVRTIDKWTTEVTLPEGAIVTFGRPNGKTKRALLDDPEQRIVLGQNGNMEETLMASCIRKVVTPADYVEGQDEEKTFTYSPNDLSNARNRQDELSICDLESFTYLFTREIYPQRTLLEEAINDIKKARASSGK